MSAEDERVIESVTELKRQARGLRDLGDRLSRRKEFVRAARAFLEAIELLHEATALLVKLVSDPTVIAQRLDCHGMRGGLYRRLANMSRNAAIEEYDQGYELEAGLPPDKPNSYNLVNRIVVRLLSEPTTVDDRGDDLRAALGEVERQVDGPRKNDVWAHADRVTLMALLDHEDRQAAVSTLIAEHPDVGTLDSCISVLEELANGVPARTFILRAAASELRAVRDKKRGGP